MSEAEEIAQKNWEGLHLLRELPSVLKLGRYVKQIESLVRYMTDVQGLERPHNIVLGAIEDMLNEIGSVVGSQDQEFLDLRSPVAYELVDEETGFVVYKGETWVFEFVGCDKDGLFERLSRFKNVSPK